MNTTVVEFRSGDPIRSTCVVRTDRKGITIPPNTDGLFLRKDGPDTYRCEFTIETPEGPRRIITTVPRNTVVMNHSSTPPNQAPAPLLA